MWSKLNEFLTGWNQQEFKIVMFVVVLLGAGLLKGWMSKSKY